MIYLSRLPNTFPKNGIKEMASLQQANSFGGFQAQQRRAGTVMHSDGGGRERKIGRGRRDTTKNNQISDYLLQL